MTETYYRPLDKQFEKVGFRFTEMQREGMIAIYHKVALQGTYHPKTVDSGFETIVIANNEAYELGGNKIESKEGYPSSEMWGVRGFTYHNLYAAQCKFDELLGKKKVVVVNDNEPSVNVPSKFNNTTFVFPATFSIKDFAETNKCEYITASLFVKEQIAAGSVKQVGEERRAAKGPMSKIYSKV
jgi:hypothetical protein